MARELKAHGEVNTKLKTFVDKILLDIQTVIEDVKAFNKGYSTSLLKIDESYSKVFAEIKLGLALLEKKIQSVNPNQVTTSLAIVQNSFEISMAPIIYIVKILPTSAP